MEVYKRKETGEFVWIFPLIAGICAIIAILTPTASYSSLGISWSWWMWNLSLMTYIGYPPVIFFLTELDFIIPSIITTIAILLSAVNLFVLSVTTRKRKLDTKNFILMSTTSAVLSICIMIYYAFAMAFAFSDGFFVEGILFPPGYHFWFEFGPSFGIILPYISAILLFIGIGLFRRYSNQRLFIVPPKMDSVREYVSPKTNTVKYFPVSTPMGARNFCPECGYKILQANMNFCTNCGFKFLNI